jgi:hypothetical protein
MREENPNNFKTFGGLSPDDAKGIKGRRKNQIEN